MRLFPLISITNNSTVLSDDEVKSYIPAYQHQLHYHFRPYWDLGATLVFAGKTKLPDSWELAFLDNSDQAGALGYHEYDATNPTGKVFAATDQQYGYKSSITGDHELLEMVADPWINLAAQFTDTEFYGYEVCDPCEADSLGYQYSYMGPNGTVTIDLSDFCLPMWWVNDSTVKVALYDYCGHLSGPGTLAPGGYKSVFVSGSGWTQYQEQHGQEVEVALEKDNPRFRPRGGVAVGS